MVQMKPELVVYAWSRHDRIIKRVHDQFMLISCIPSQCPLLFPSTSQHLELRIAFHSHFVQFQCLNVVKIFHLLGWKMIFIISSPTTFFLPFFLLWLTRLDVVTSLRKKYISLTPNQIVKGDRIEVSAKKRNEMNINEAVAALTMESRLFCSISHCMQNVFDYLQEIADWHIYRMIITTLTSHCCGLTIPFGKHFFKITQISVMLEISERQYQPYLRAFSFYFVFLQQWYLISHSLFPMVRIRMDVN